MAQRGGDVTTHFRFGKKVYSSLIKYGDVDFLLSFEELERLVTIFCDLGVSKIRVTGGEPFSRRGCMPFLERLRKIRGVERLHITTNGVRTLQFLDDLAAISIDGINLSLDTLEPERFRTISRRDYLDAVLETLDWDHQTRHPSQDQHCHPRRHHRCRDQKSCPSRAIHHSPTRASRST